MIDERAIRAVRAARRAPHRVMVFIQIVEQVINGLLVGAYYLLIALGLSLIFSLGGLVNLAHGAFYALGAYLAVQLADHIGFAGALVVSPVLVAIFGLVVERFLFRRFYRQDPALGLLLTFGLAMVIEQTAADRVRRSTHSVLDPAAAAKARSCSATSSIRSTGS